MSSRGCETRSLPYMHIASTPEVLGDAMTEMSTASQSVGVPLAVEGIVCGAGSARGLQQQPRKVGQSVYCWQVPRRRVAASNTAAYPATGLTSENQCWALPRVYDLSISRRFCTCKLFCSHVPLSSIPWFSLRASTPNRCCVTNTRARHAAHFPIPARQGRCRRLFLSFSSVGFVGRVRD